MLYYKVVTKCCKDFKTAVKIYIQHAIHDLHNSHSYVNPVNCEPCRAATGEFGFTPFLNKNALVRAIFGHYFLFLPLFWAIFDPN